jgi:hypothetical protein
MIQVAKPDNTLLVWHLSIVSIPELYYYTTKNGKAFSLHQGGFRIGLNQDCTALMIKHNSFSPWTQKVKYFA